MGQKEDKSRKRSKGLLILGLVLLLVCVIAGGAYSKYRKDVVMTGKVSASNRLVGQFQLLEHKKTLEDGAYRLTDETTVSDSVWAIPGATIPMDPYLTILDKSDVPALLYIEVIDPNAEDVLSYKLTEDWTLLDVEGYHKGAVYVFQNGQVLGDFSDPDLLRQIEILQDGEVTISDESEAEVESLSFCGYLIQTDGNQTPKELYEEKMSHK